MVFSDPYTHEESELQVLKSEPTSFLILGKPKCGKSEVAAYLAREWGAKLVSEVPLIVNQMEEQTELGKEILETLNNGGTIGADITSKLYMDAINSEASAHYGVVIDGIPDFENKELVDLIKRKVKILVHLKLSDNDIRNARTNLALEPKSGKSFCFLGKLPDAQQDNESEGIDGMGEDEVSLAPFDPKKIIETRQWVTEPENFETNIKNSIKNYSDNLLTHHESILVNCEQFSKGVVIDVCSFCGLNSREINSQLLNRIHSLDPRRGLVPIELKKTDEELPEEINTEELLRTVREINKPAGKFRWRRSRWGRYCPVALSEGEIVPGAPTLALAFLGKMYFFSTQERLENFKTNPRKYLLPQVPRNPVRVAVTGQPSAAKSSLVQALATHYSCEVINPHDLVLAELQNAKSEAYEKKLAEVTQLAIGMVQTSLGKDEKVEANDPRVQAKVNEQMEAKSDKNEPVTLAPIVYVQKIKEKIDQIVEKRAAAGQTVTQGRWIIDGFPNTKDDWNAMTEAELFPDDLIISRDQSDKYEHLIEAHYQMNKEKYDEEFHLRMADDLKQSEGNNEIQMEEKPTRPPIDAPEFENFRNILRSSESLLTQLTTQIHQPELNVFQLPYRYDPTGLTASGMVEDAVNHIDSRFVINGWAWSGLDQQDEEDDNEITDGQEEGEDEEDDKKKRNWGVTSFYDPVKLYETDILVPGSTEAQVKFKDQIYCFQDNENREVFLANPMKYIDTSKGPLQAPPLRLCCIGQRAAGKSSQMRQLAKEQGVFFIDWRQLLEEKMMVRFKQRLGADHNEQNRLNDEKKFHLASKMKEILDAIVYPPLEETEESVQEEEEFDDFEAAIKGHLESVEPIPYEILEKILEKFWKQEPFKSKGFILEGFPSCSDDIRCLMGTGLFPDAVLTINCDEEISIKRMMPERMQLWTEWRSLKDKRLKAIKAQKLKVREEWIASRVKEYMGEQTIEEGDDVSAIEEEQRERVLEEFSEAFLETEDDTPESLAEADERIRTEITDEYSLQQQRLINISDMLVEAQIQQLEVSGNRKQEQVAERIEKSLMSYLPPNRDSIFEKVTPVSLAAAENLIRSNYYQLSSFGKWDPVLLKEGVVFRPLAADQGGAVCFPLVYGPYIYYLSSLETRNKFIAQPLEYIRATQKSTIHTPPPQTPIKLAIVGPPKSGKSTLATRFAAELGVMKISIPDVVQLLLSKFSETVVAENIHGTLLSGKTLPTDLLMIGLDLILLDERAQTRGYIFDGFPTNTEQFQAMQRRSILPYRIIELEISDDESFARNDLEISQKSKFFRDLELAKFYPKESDEGEEEEEEEEPEDDIMQDKKISKTPAEDLVSATDQKEIMAKYLETFRREIESVRAEYQSQYRNWHKMDGKVNRWKLWHDAFEFVSKSVSKLQLYMKNIKNGQISSLDGICITPKEFKTRIGKFCDFCPVSLCLRNELVDCSKQEGMKFAVEWKRQYYRVAGKRELDLILAMPEKFLDSDLKLPKSLPRSLEVTLARQRLKSAELDGFCPITFKDNGSSYEALRRGSENFAVEYEKKLYVMISEENRQKFLRKPRDYIGQQLPSKLPPKPETIVTVSLPTGGYLEQGVARLLTDAIHSVGELKPKFPFMSVTNSSLRFIAIYLKSHNPAIDFHTRERWRGLLKEFKTDCENISFLGRKMTRRYRPVDKRLPELDQRLTRFFNLKERPEYLNSVSLEKN